LNFLSAAGGTVLETGTATVDPTTLPASIDLVPNGDGATHLDALSTNLIRRTRATVLASRRSRGMAPR